MRQLDARAAGAVAGRSADHRRRHPPRPAHPAGAQALSEWPTIPQVFVKGELIGGADITEELNASGELRQKIDEALGEHAQTVRTVELRWCSRDGVRLLASPRAVSAELRLPAPDEQRQAGELEEPWLLVALHRFPSMLPDRVAGVWRK